MIAAQAPAHAPALTLDNLSISDADGRLLVDDVSLSLPRGGILTLIGETGSGKSLIAQAIFGLLPEGLSARGTVRLGGGEPVAVTERGRLAQFWREQIMLIPQEPSVALDPTMRVGRQMELAGVARTDIPAALREVDLAAGTAAAFPFALSGGMSQRVLVATALGVGAPIIVADEPTKGLDPDRVGQSVALMAGLAQADRSLLVITHDPTVARGLGGLLAIMREGRVIEAGPTDQLLAAPASDYARAWLAADPADWRPCHRCCDMGSLALSAHALAFAWPGGKPLFSDIDIHLPRGGVLAVMGASGCGKSTLGNILLGLLPPSGGTVEWKGVDIHADPRWLAAQRQRHQKLHQDPVTAFLPHLTIARQFAALGKVRPGLDVAQALPPLLDRLRVRTELLDRRPSEISGGEAQRLALARLLLLDPDVIVADEPTSRLDPIVQKETITLLRDLVDERGLSLVLISHDAALAAAVADETLRLG
jgi:peptide/nickel transport system ATP-binding protein